jgi:Fe-S cluster assembly iron-binding protein IscA
MTGPNLIIESQIFSEAEVVKSNSGRAVFRCPIQTSDEINQNHRMYPKTVLGEGMENCRPRMERLAFFSELDHPLPTGNDSIDGIRQTTVALEKVSHIIRDYEFRNNVLYAEMQTTSTPCGGILFGLLKDKAGVGFSMRGLAELDRRQDHSIVRSPLTIIAFDAVSLPSHRSAVVDFNEMRFEHRLLTENQNSKMICHDGRCFMPDYFDKLVETKVIRFLGKWV